jgi:hypothetical protein
MGEKFKSILADERSFLAIVVVLVALASFALGRYSTMPVGSLWGQGAGQGGPAGVSMAYTELLPKGDSGTTQTESSRVALPPEPVVESATSGPYVASKAGTKYHHVSCGGAKQIKPENKLYFPTQDGARAAGYLPAANCKILNP